MIFTFLKSISLHPRSQGKVGQGDLPEGGGELGRGADALQGATLRPDRSPAGPPEDYAEGCPAEERRVERPADGQHDHPDDGHAR